MRRALLVAILAHAAVASAVGASIAPAARAQGPAAPKVDPEVQKHFALGNDLYGEQRYADALIEYDAAYDLSRNWKILYNRGQCLVLLRREPEAIDSFQRYLDEGGKSIDPERRKQVETDVGKLKERLGFIALAGVPDGASIDVDGRPAATTPLAKPIAAGAGMHEITVRAAGGGLPVIKQVKVIAGQQVSVAVQLPTVAPQPGPPLVPSTQPPPAAASGATQPPPDSISPPPPPPRRPPGGLPAPGFMITLALGGAAPTNDTTRTSSGGNKVLVVGELGASWRLHPFWELGLFVGGGAGKYGGSTNGTNADYGYGTYGLRARIHPIRGKGFDGWLGFDVGGFQEKWSQLGTNQGDTKGTGTALGLAFGVDLSIARTWAVGGVMRYVGSSRVTCDTSASNPTGACPSQTDARSFIELGLRVVWDIPYGAGRRETTTAAVP